MKQDLKESLVTRDAPAMISYVGASRVALSWETRTLLKPRRRKA